MREFSIIVATDANNGIGKEGGLPWHLPSDLRFFKDLTSKAPSADKTNVVIMGRKTWESIPDKFRPLAGRINIVLTRKTVFGLPQNVLSARSFQEALERLEQEPVSAKAGDIFVIGGGQIYQEALACKECTLLYITQILTTFECDAYFPEYQDSFKRVYASPPQQDGDLTYQFTQYRRVK